MKILPLGVGEAFARTLRQTNFLIIPAEGKPFLVDFGHAAVRTSRSLHIDLRLVEGVVVSHLHGDHIGGLEELAFTSYFAWRRRPALFLPEALLPLLWDHALSAGLGQSLPDGDGGFLQPALDTYFRVCPLRSLLPVSLGSVTLTPFPTPHAPGRPSFGFALTDRATGKSVLLTCDSRLDHHNLQRWGAGADAVFHDCQLSGGPANVHATLDELLLLPDRWQKKILLTHYGDDWKAYRGYTGRMRFARQGYKYSF